MAGPRQLVSPPAFVDRNFGLLSVVQPRYDDPDGPWRNGVTYTTLCGIGGSTNDYCVTGAPPLKVPNLTTPTRGATAFTPFAEVDCPPVGYDEQEHRARAADALTRTESWQVERAFWTGGVNITGGPPATSNIVYPHLAASAPVVQGINGFGVTMQTAAVLVTGGVVLDIVEAVGYLEAALGNCNNGQGVIHVPMVLAEQGFRANVFKVDGPQVKTQAGNLVALGAGYPGTGPDGQFVPNAVYVYATGQVFAYRSGIFQPDFRSSVNRLENTVKSIAERTYVLGWDCCHFAALVSVGGIVTGLPLAPG